MNDHNGAPVPKVVTLNRMLQALFVNRWAEQVGPSLRLLVFLGTYHDVHFDKCPFGTSLSLPMSELVSELGASEWAIRAWRRQLEALGLLRVVERGPERKAAEYTVLLNAIFSCGELPGQQDRKPSLLIPHARKPSETCAETSDAHAREPSMTCAESSAYVPSPSVSCTLDDDAQNVENSETDAQNVDNSPTADPADQMVADWHLAFTDSLIPRSADQPEYDEFAARVRKVPEDRRDTLDRNIRKMLDDEKLKRAQTYTLGAVRHQIASMIAHAVKGDPDGPKPQLLWKQVKTIWDANAESLVTSDDVGRIYRQANLATAILADAKQLDSLVDRCHRKWPMSARDELALRITATLKGGASERRPKPSDELTPEQEAAHLEHLKAARARLEAVERERAEEYDRTHPTADPEPDPEPEPEVEGLSREAVDELLRQEQQR